VSTCRELSDALYDLVAGELSSERQDDLRRHADGCTACAALVESYQITIRLARRLAPVSLPPECLVRLQNALAGIGIAPPPL
jgi:anti-sigma factor RsiW